MSALGLVILLLPLFILIEGQLDSTGQYGNGGGRSCNASCLGAEEVWPPRDFNIIEDHELTQLIIRLKGVNVSHNSTEFIHLGVIPVEGKPFHYSITVPNFSFNNFTNLVIVQESSNRTALKQMVRQLK